ncbi:MAG: tetratricopeptide repeat protein, partial [Leptolyngbya sp. ERB_1_2]
MGLELIQFARTYLDLQPPEELDLTGRVAFCLRHWQPGAVLLVIDNVQEYDAIAQLFRGMESRFKVLLTTRSRFGSPVREFAIEVLTEAASLEVLRSLVKDGRIDQDLETAKRVCEWLGYLPLGLELVGRYLARRQDTSVAQLYARLQEKRLEARALLKAEPGMTASLGVTAAFELSWQELGEEAQGLAKLLSGFAAAQIDWAWVVQCWQGEDEEELEDLRDEDLLG